MHTSTVTEIVITVNPVQVKRLHVLLQYESYKLTAARKALIHRLYFLTLHLERADGPDVTLMP
jgi:hypothetical protein